MNPKPHRPFAFFARHCSVLLTCLLLACGGPAPNTRDVIVVSVSDQKLWRLIRIYPNTVVR